MPDAPIDLGFAAKLPPREAIAFFEQKGYATSWDWWEVWESAHARAFTVAKAVQADVLQSIRQALDKALADGQTRRQFARELEPRLRALGWWGRQIVVDPDGGAERVQLGSPHRLRTIFDSNMRSTFGAARQRQQMVNTESRPFWLYDARNDSHVRPSHAAMDGMVFPADDPIWASHYPPNGWNCRCRVRALTAEQVRSRRLQVRGSEGALEEVEQEVGVDRRTGEVVTRPGTAYRFQTATGENVTMLPDPGWGSAPDGLPPQPAPPRPRGWNPESASPAAARDHLAAAATDARRRLSDRQEDLQRVTGRIDDPTSPTTSRDLSAQAALIDQVEAARVDVAAAGRRALFRERPAPWRGGAGPVLGERGPAAAVGARQSTSGAGSSRRIWCPGSGRRAFWKASSTTRRPSTTQATRSVSLCRAGRTLCCTSCHTCSRRTRSCSRPRGASCRGARLATRCGSSTAEGLSAVATPGAARTGAS